MSKLDKQNNRIVYMAFKIGIVVGFIFGLITMHLTSCQPSDSLKGLNCPCKVISAELTYHGHVVTYTDKDGKLSDPVISEALFDQYHKNKPLNK